jgi:hypothetical protein
VRAVSAVAHDPVPAPWVWLVAPGVEPAQGAVQELVAALGRLDGLAEPALVAARIVRADGSLHAAHEPLPRWGDKDLEVAAAARGLLAVRAASTACALVRRDVLDALGPEAAGPRGRTAALLRDRAGYVAPNSVAVLDGPPPARADRLRELRADGWSAAERLWLATLALRG